MNARERIEATLRHREHDQIPFVCLDEIMPRGDLELSLRQRGMGLVLTREVVWCEYPHVQMEVKSEGDIETTTFRTPAGVLEQRRRKQLGSLPNGVCAILDGLVKSPADWEAVKFLAEDTIFHIDANAYNDTMFEIGGDGLVRCQGPRPAYEITLELYGGYYGAAQTRRAVILWAAEQKRPSFGDLLETIAHQEERRLEAVLSSPVTWVSLGRIDGTIGPTRWREFILPFYQRIVPRLHEAGKIVSISVHSPFLQPYGEVLAQAGVDAIESFTPPPGGDWPLAKARKILGDTVIWVNLPEATLWWPPDSLKTYLQDLLENDPHCEALMIGFTEIGLLGIVDEESDTAYRRSLEIVMSVLEKSGCLY